MCTARGLPSARIGVVDVLETGLDVQGQFTVSERELRAAWQSPIASRFG
jgi:phosphoribosylformylglycinamidine synthase